MCGLIGAYVPAESGNAFVGLEGGLARMAHRGPDGTGKVAIPTSRGAVHLGHLRLSIIDLSDAGLQPMTSANGRFVMVYNGEIYNYIELREELRLLGHQFNSQSDSEVLLAAWSHWGENCLSRLDGMFAFAMFDRVDETITLVRDSFGIKPLYYSVDANGSARFASEVPAILEIIGRDVGLNWQRIYAYLMWGGYDDGADTFYDDVLQLRPGHLIVIRAGLNQVSAPRRWWWPAIAQRDSQTFDDAADELRELFLESVKRQLRSDVPLGIALSGGVDSSAIACAVRHVAPDMPIHTFSYLAAGSHVNEEKWCKIVNDRIGAIPHSINDLTGPSPSEILDKVIHAQGEPFGSTSILAQYRVFELAKSKGITVTLDGQGADELLAGYDGYPTALFRSYLDEHKYMDLARFQSAWRSWPGRDGRKFLLHLGEASTPTALRRLALRIGGYELAPDWLNKEAFFSAGGQLRGPEEIPSSDEGKGRRLAERLREALTRNRLPTLLRHGDRNSMAWAIESRVPFLSPKIAEFTLGLPEKFLMSEGGETKHIFRKAMRGIVPDPILDRRDKIGFETPERELLNQMRPEIARWLGVIDGVQMFDAGRYRAAIDRVLDGSDRFSFRAWRMVNLSRWLSLQPANVNIHSASRERLKWTAS